MCRSWFNAVLLLLRTWGERGLSTSTSDDQWRAGQHAGSCPSSTTPDTLRDSRDASAACCIRQDAWLSNNNNNFFTTCDHHDPPLTRTPDDIANERMLRTTTRVLATIGGELANIMQAFTASTGADGGGNKYRSAPL
ncbi:hypothetical protein EDC04DRAFT_871874 [Pisolithus marmoratus]|nr:hypothetical protein EDC04DRAFT_871874 [Pisolithus marmoratus]